MFGWVRKTFGRTASKTAGREVTEEVGEQAGKNVAQQTSTEVGESSAIKSGLIGAGAVGALVYHDEILEQVGGGIGSFGKGVSSELFDSPLMLGVGLLMVGGIFYAIFK